MVTIPSMKGAIMGVILIVISIVTLPVVWDTIHDSGSGALRCFEHNSSAMAGTDCEGNTCTASSCCVSCINGTAKSLLSLVPFIYVGIFIIAGAVLAYKA